MAKDTYKSSGKFVRTEPEAEPEVVVEAPKPKVRVKKVVKAEEEPTLNSADGKLIANSMLEALEAAGIIVIKTKEPEPAPKKSEEAKEPALKPATEEELKPKAKPAEKKTGPRVVSTMGSKPAEKPAEKPQPKTEKVAYLRQGAYLDFWWRDPITGDANISSDLWAAKQASHNNYTPVWVWYKDGIRVRLLTDEEIKKFCP